MTHTCVRVRVHVGSPLLFLQLSVCIPASIYGCSRNPEEGSRSSVMAVLHPLVSALKMACTKMACTVLMSTHSLLLQILLSSRRLSLSFRPPGYSADLDSKILDCEAVK